MEILFISFSFGQIALEKLVTESSIEKRAQITYNLESKMTEKVFVISMLHFIPPSHRKARGQIYSATDRPHQHLFRQIAS